MAAREIFAHGDRRHVAEAAMAEVADAGMMHGVRSQPVVVRGQRQDSEGTADPVVEEPPAKECTVPAIMLDHEEAHEESRRRNRKDQAKDRMNLQARPHQRPKGDEGNDRDGKLARTPRAIRIPVKGEKSGPLMHVGGQRWRRIIAHDT
jgi:hypothetical protein